MSSRVHMAAEQLAFGLEHCCFLLCIAAGLSSVAHVRKILTFASWPYGSGSGDVADPYDRDGTTSPAPAVVAWLSHWWLSDRLW